MSLASLAPELRLGIEMIDHQHGQFYALINRALLRDQHGDPRFKAGEIIDALSDYIFEHFRAEEALMESRGFAGLADHRRQHAEFVGRFIEFNRRFRLQEEGLEDELLVFVVNWLTAHIRREDRKYADFFADSV